jgi:Ca2+-binding RTX toxin-like protein
MCHGRRATILGSPNDDNIVGTRAPDVIVTLGGDDQVSRLRIGDQACTGRGNDTVTNINSPLLGVDLGPGDDRMSDLHHLSYVHGGPGNDRITLPIILILVAAGSGDDTLRVVPGRPPHSASDLANSPCITYRSAPRRIHLNLLRGLAQGLGRDRIVNVHCVRGSRFGDFIVGSRYDDDIGAGAGGDEVWSLGGDDVVSGESSPGFGDVIHLGAGNDFAFPGAGPDRVYGDSGNDQVEAGPGADYLEGGDGDDVLYASHRCYDGVFPVTLDRLPNEVFGGPGNDFLVGDLGNDRIEGGSGLDEGSGGHQDGRIDWIESIERISPCPSP